jgi:hypothetical protein
MARWRGRAVARVGAFAFLTALLGRVDAAPAPGLASWCNTPSATGYGNQVLRRHLRIPGIRFQLARARRFANNGHHLTPVSQRLAVSVRELAHGLLGTSIPLTPKLWPVFDGSGSLPTPA